MKWTLILDVKFKYEWIPPFKLTYIQLNNIRIGPNFLVWLKTQNELDYLGLTNAGISDTILHGLWKSCQMTPIGVCMKANYKNKYHTFVRKFIVFSKTREMRKTRRQQN
jgi:hypothetical protein